MTILVNQLFIIDYLCKKDRVMNSKLELIFMFMLFVLVGFSQKNKEIEIADSLMKESNRYAKENKEKTIELLNQAYEIFKNKNYKPGLAASNNEMSSWYLEENQKDTALNLALKALRYANELEDSLLESVIYLNLGNIYYDLKNTKYSRIYFEKAIRYGEQSTKASAIANIGLLYSDQGKIDSAFYFFQKANQLFLSLKDSSVNVLSNIAITNMNMGTIAMDRGDYAEAKKYLNKSLRTSYAIKDFQRIVYNYLNFGQIFIEEKNFELAEEVIYRAQKITDSLSYLSLGSYTIQAMSALHYAKGDYKKAYNFYKKYSERKDSLTGIDIENKIANLQMKYEAEQQLLQIQSLENEKRLNNYRTGIITFIILLFSSIAIYYLNKRRLKNRERLAYAEKHREETEQKLKKAKEDIVHYTKLVQENNERIECFEKELLANSKVDSKELQAKQEKLRSMKILKDEDWVYYKNLFKDVDPIFYDKVMSIPNLTEGDKRQILLLKLGYTNKMSADVLGISTEGIKRARQRLSKKLKLEDAGKLEDYFLSI